MVAYIPYLVKCVLISALLFGYYLLVLQNKSFHKYNRFYLLAIIPLSLLLPLVNFNAVYPSEAAALPSFIQRDVVSETIMIRPMPSSFWSTDTLAAIFYFLVVTIMLLVLVKAIVRLAVIKKKSQCDKHEGILLIRTAVPGTPFSFFRWIFIPPDMQFDTEPNKKILAHEIAHIRQRHSLDKLFIHSVVSFFWINPVFWLIRKELAMIHEFLADEASFTSADVSEFSKITLNSIFSGNYTWPVTHNFFNSSVKRRLIMILKNRQKVSYFSRLLAVPILVLLFVAFAVKAQNSPVIINALESSEQPVSTHLSPGIALPGNPSAPAGALGQLPAAADTIPTEEKLFVKVEKRAEFPGGENAWNRYMSKILEDHADEFGRSDEGVCTVSFVVGSDGSISGVQALTMKGTRLASVVIEAVRKGPKWRPAMQGGRTVNSLEKRSVPLTAKKDTPASEPATVDVAPPPVAATTDIRETKEARPVQPVFTKMDKEPEFPGGSQAWAAYFSDAISRLAAADSNGAGKVRFIVLTDGSVRSVEALTGGDTEVVKAAIDAIRKGPKWIPGEQNGHAVNAYKTLSVSVGRR